MMTKMLMSNSEDMSSEEIEIFKKETEARFFRMLNDGEDIRVFLFLPYDFISENVKKHLDEFLLKEAYSKIEENVEEFEKNFTVYEDSLISISIEDQAEKIEILEKMIEYFVEKESYEKCAKIQNIVNSIKQKP